MMRLQLFLLLIGVFASYVAAASAPTFCKCTCFKNSTLIQLGPQGNNPNTFENANPNSKSTSNPSAPPPSEQALLSRSPTPDLNSLEKRAASASCTQCTRGFCLSQHLPICKDAEENDVVAMCFQRDSRKDQIIVWGFILGTTGLLGWAATRRVIELREGKKGAALGLGGGSGGARGRDRGVYMPVGRDGT
ncbi:uncharacterized protein GGS22DRAFT_97967 [Annulohypoxylon maeteangense]|uniref:uncharacterized protein n=1 Tax=Annulohypoxylon maeteangense TaxID=1927788 RepID=UPI002008E508|nr:uncharacterized protein GGS22DRAFT_97967 [Annulohypoxylon maeteangense]KAI0888492.1 hypothetical protein GGS22DRAFT_97967 [Annulohypoxylon maeteangense]